MEQLWMKITLSKDEMKEEVRDIIGVVMYSGYKSFPHWDGFYWNLVSKICRRLVRSL